MMYHDELSVAEPGVKNALLFACLSDDGQRAALYSALRANQPVFEVLSRAPVEPEQTDEQQRTRTQTATKKTQSVYLLTRRDDIKLALEQFSNAPYKPLGSGTFILALDPAENHLEKRRFLIDAMRPSGGQVRAPDEIHCLAAMASQFALVGPCKNERFDLVTDVVEPAALRFVAAFFGIPDADHPLLQRQLRQVHEAMIMQMFARHFVRDTQTLQAGNEAGGQLAQRIGQLLAASSRVGQTAEMLAIIASNEKAAVKLLSATARQAQQLNSAVQESVDGFVAEISRPGLAARTLQLWDQVLDYGAIRLGLPGFVAGFPQAPEELRERFLTVLERMCAEKTTAGDELIPRRIPLDQNKRLKPQYGDIDARQDIHSRTTVIERLVAKQADRPSEDLVVAVAGSIAGLMGNVIAGASIVIDRFFKLDLATRQAMLKHAKQLDVLDIHAAADGARALQPFVAEALRLDPPAAFIPRKANGNVQLHGCLIPDGAEVLVALGAATRDPAAVQRPDEFDVSRPKTDSDYIFGQPPGTERTHRCIGDYIALPLICHIVRSVLSLPGLACQEVDGQEARLKKKWGYICESLPLRYDVKATRKQEPLNVVMKIRSPIEQHVKALRVTVKDFAPHIERLLVASRMVHFARFVLLENDTKLGLFTIYDGDFDNYIDHFARIAGPLFDKIFEHIEDPPTTPVRSNPRAFVEHIRKHDLPSLGGYFFSAFPRRTVR